MSRTLARLFRAASVDLGEPIVEAGAHGLQEGDRTASGPGPQRRAATIFRRRIISDRCDCNPPALQREAK
jgi:hypothetical protein